MHPPRARKLPWSIASSAAGYHNLFEIKNFRIWYPSLIEAPVGKSPTSDPSQYCRSNCLPNVDHAPHKTGNCVPRVRALQHFSLCQTILSNGRGAPAYCQTLLSRLRCEAHRPPPRRGHRAVHCSGNTRPTAYDRFWSIEIDVSRHKPSEIEGHLTKRPVYPPTQ